MKMFTAEELKIVTAGIYHVWQGIGSDCMQCAEACGESLDNEAAIEGCIDADRLEQYGYDEAHVLVRRACKAHGYTKVMKELCRNISLA